MRTANQARARNWTKRKIVGSYFGLVDNNLLLTEGEIGLLKSINNNLQALISMWDENSEKLGFVIKPHICALCGRRSSKEYLTLTNTGLINFCKKHKQEEDDFQL